MKKRLAIAAAGLVATIALAGVPGVAQAAPAASPPPIQYGDDYVHRDGGGEVGTSAVIAGPGFNTFNTAVPQRLRDSYTIKIAAPTQSWADVGSYRTWIKRAAAQASRFAAVKLTVSDTTVASNYVPAAREFLAILNTVSPCGNGTSTPWAGCAQHSKWTKDTAAGVEYIEAGRMWFNKPGAGTTVYALHSLVAHELGHLLGLDHFDNMFEGRSQVMRSGLNGATNDATYGDYQRGDINGMRFTHPGGQGPKTLECCIVGDPDVTSQSAGRLDVVARGTDNQLYHRFSLNGTWSPWGGLGGALTSDPTIVSVGPGRLDVFARGAANQLVHIGYNGGWTPWGDLGGAITNAPDAVHSGGGKIVVAVRGTNGMLQTKTFSGSWGPFASVAGSITGGPSVVSTPAGVKYFARNSSNNLIVRENNTTWKSLGGSLTSDPEATAFGNNTIHVIVKGNDNTLWRMTSHASGVWPTVFSSMVDKASSGVGAVASASNIVDVVYRNQSTGQLMHKLM